MNSKNRLSRALFLALVHMSVATSNVANAQTVGNLSKPYKTACDLEDEEAEIKNAKFEASLSEMDRRMMKIGPREKIDWKTAKKLLTPRKKHEKPKELRFDPAFHTGRINIKFAEGSEVYVTNGVLMSLDKKDKTDQINKEISRSGVFFLAKPLFSRPIEHLKLDKACGERKEGVELADLTLWITLDSGLPVDSAYGERVAAMIKHLINDDIVETLQFDAKASKPPRSDIPPTTPNLAWTQGHMNAANATPAGIDTFYSWSLGDGGKGAGVKFIIIDEGVLVSHEDLLDPYTPVIQPPNLTPGQMDHGTAALGVVVADHSNGIGVNGIAPLAQYTGVSYNGSDGTHNPANAVDIAANNKNLTVGDVILLEFGWCGSGVPLPPGPGTGKKPTDSDYWTSNCVPAEFDPLRFDAIERATAKGIIVVETAHNGDIDLDDPAFNGKFTATAPTFVDSRAIIVGSRKINGERRSDSTYGSRVDVSAWGENVGTIQTFCSTAFDVCNNPASQDPNQAYLTNFSGTSAAGPIVAGAIVSIQGLQKARGGPPIGPKAMRDLLRRIGTAQVAPSNKNVGKMPDLKAIWLWMIADSDSDGILNVDELALGRNPDFDERKALPILLSEE